MIAYPPINIIDSIAEYFSYVHDSLKNKKPLKPISQIVPDAKNDSKKIKNLKIILIIGESARAKNFAINGYERQTTPQLEKVKNLLSFKNVSTPYNLTSDSVSSMLSSHTQKNFQPSRNDEESIIKLFEKLGYSTAWFSAQKAFGDDNALIILAMQAQKHFFSNSISKKIGGGKIYDEYLLEFLDKEIDNDRDNFVILHAQGSHFLYFERYPQKFEKFTPTCKKTNPKECSKEELTNAYDNSILYSDYFISEIINRLKNKNAILFYISDHGQFLGENGLYYHGNTGGVDYEEHKVPLFLWMSESVLKQQFYHKKFNKAATKTETTLSSNNLFDSLLDCSGVDSKLFERKMSLCK
jgi:glucan phosphoethanolaminetransferase (alkaline phosphatase superfamily)